MLALCQFSVLAAKMDHPADSGEFAIQVGAVARHYTTSVSVQGATGTIEIMSLPAATIEGGGVAGDGRPTDP